jgi:hypothetical protein
VIRFYETLFGSKSIEQKKITKSEYDIIAKWWPCHNWPVMPYDALPESGLIIYSESTPIVAAWLYKTDSSISWLEFMVSNPDVDKKVRGEAIDLLINSLIELAQSSGFKIIFSSIRVPRLIKRMEECGFSVTDTKMTNMIRVL